MRMCRSWSLRVGLERGSATLGSHWRCRFRGERTPQRPRPGTAAETPQILEEWMVTATPCLKRVLLEPMGRACRSRV